jgi:sec-independent protein translocase protein TatC
MKVNPLRASPAEMPFLDHLEELRWRILWSLLALAICTMAAFFVVFKFDAIGLLMEPIRPYLPAEQQKLIYLGVTEPFFVMFNLALVVGIVVSSPVIGYQAWAFFAPALTKKERRAIVPALYLGVLLFAVGAAVAYFVAVPFTVKFMFGLNQASLMPQITAAFYFGFLVRMLVAFGAIFELPVVVMIMAAMGLLTSDFLKRKRRWAIAGMAIVSAMITPGDAITATVVMWGPMLLLYELSIALAKLVERGRARALAAESDALPEPS